MTRRDWIHMRMAGSVAVGTVNLKRPQHLIRAIPRPSGLHILGDVPATSDADVVPLTPHWPERVFQYS